MVEYIIPAFATILVAVIEAIAAHERKRLKAQSAHENEMRLLQMKMTDATLQLSVVTANALTGGHNNGNVEKARTAAEEANREFNSFLEKLATEVL